MRAAVRLAWLLTALLTGGGARAATFGAWIPDFTEGVAQMKAHAKDLTSVSLFYYGVTVTGGVVNANKPEDPALIGWARKRGIKVFATIGGTPPILPAAYQGENAARLVAALCGKAERFEFDGIDLDLEGINSASRADYTAFVDRLNTALKAMKRPRLLAVTVQDFPNAEDEATMAFDYAALGRIADEVRVMCYDYSYDKPGPLMPHEWYSNILTFASSRIPKGKFIAALPWYGRDWVAGGPDHEDLLWSQRAKESGLDGFQVLMKRYRITPAWDEEGGEFHFSYTKDGQPHDVWMPEARKFAWMADEALKAGVAGIYVWHLAFPHPETWKTVRKIRRHEGGLTPVVK